jgi:formylglycine-generating enzyme required for sulfatase activity
MPDDRERELAREDFIVLYVADRERGEERAEADYLKLYPGCESVISEEWDRLRRVLEEGPSAGPEPRREGEEGPARSWTLGRYRIREELGRGAQGTVFLARDEVLGRDVALKILKASWSGSDALVRRFEIEAKALARLDHAGIAAVYDAGSARGLQYLVMRYVEGHTLAEEVRRAPAPDKDEILRRAGLVEKASRALHEAHERGLVHRDVKPGNIMVTKAGEPVVLDFGLARLLEIAEPDLTITGDLIGTPAFMAPEQKAGDRRRIDRRTDVFGLGATLRELAGGDRRVVPRDLRAVLATALDPDPDRRYATAASLADDLRRIRLGQRVAVRPAGPLRTLVAWCRRAPAAAALLFLPPIVLGGGLAALALKNAEIEAAARDFRARKAEADSARLAANRRFEEFLRLDDLRTVDELRRREDELWPPAPLNVPALERWLADARELLKRLPEHRAALAVLRERGRVVVEREPGIDPAIDRLLHVERVRAAAEQELAAGSAPDSRRAHLSAVSEEARRRIPVLERAAATPSRFRYRSPEDQWLDHNLSRLVAGLEALEGPSLHEGTVAWVEHRIVLTREIAWASLVRAAGTWREARSAIANRDTDPAYGGLEIDPVPGLVPIGRDPRSGLWEFAHLASGEPPARSAAGDLVVTESSSLVLVLVPGGRSRMGARQPVHEDERPRDHVDPAARDEEGPVTEVLLDPFFISKYEMTQGQWLRATGKNPSHARPERLWEHGYRPNLRHPVEQVSFLECEDTLRRLGLVLPTEAQWEHAARAGTSTPWWPGETIESFLAIENLADRTFVVTQQVEIVHDARREDGWAGPGPVGVYPANPFGLHDVIGNVAELCADRIAFYTAPALPGDGLRHNKMIDARVVRGGAFATPSSGGRSARRFGQPETARTGTIGVRPALLLRDP